MARKHRIIPELTNKDIQRFWSKVEIKSPEECWLWKPKSRCGIGYGYFSVGSRKTGRNIGANRIAYFIYYTINPKDLCVLHTCDNPPCCNPFHLFLGTIQDNTADMVKKGRQAKGDRQGSRLHPETRPRGDDNPARKYPERMPRGERHGLSKLTEIKVLEIRSRFSGTFGELTLLGKEFGVTKQTIRSVVFRKIWRHI